MGKQIKWNATHLREKARERNRLNPDQKRARLNALRLNKVARYANQAQRDAFHRQIYETLTPDLKADLSVIPPPTDLKSDLMTATGKGSQIIDTFIVEIEDALKRTSKAVPSRSTSLPPTELISE